jgi:GntR family transcriptional repressor for pyruvate dehydrogenase complex
VTSELLEPVGQDLSLTTRVVHQLGTLILDRQLQPGDRLPPEHELVTQLGVSRTVVREAIRTLVARHMVEVRRGIGTVIANPTAQVVARSMTQSMTLFLRGSQSDTDYAQVHELRRILEIEIAGLAAARRTNEDLQKLEAILRETPATLEDRDHFARNDVDFHATLAAATHNPLLALVLDSVADIMLKVRWIAFDLPGGRTRGPYHHRLIFEQVAAGDPQRARQAMHDHLIEAEATVRQVLAQRRRQGDTEADSPD